MILLQPDGLVVLAVAVATSFLLILRPFGWPEAVWAVAAALVLMALGRIAPVTALHAVGRGLDVYLFLTGMMLLSELARREGLFDWLAALAARAARGSPQRLFTLIYGLGVVVTVFLSNDATAVVLTPAVHAICRTAGVRNPMPYLLICAFIANAASFVLPISNPANLVMFPGDTMPPLAGWLRIFTLPSVVAIVATYAALRWTQRHALAQESVATTLPSPRLSLPATVAALGLVATGGGLLAASAMGADLGRPTCLAGLATLAVVWGVTRRSPLPVLRDVSWGVLALVAGLFVIVQALADSGLIAGLSAWLGPHQAAAPQATAVAAGLVTGIATNLFNNLPVGLMASGVAIQAQAPQQVTAALLIGVDLGPNLAVSGSLATILWLTALRREGLRVGAGAFLRLGAVVMPPALLLALASLLL